MKREDWAAVFCSVIFGIVGGFIAYGMKPALCWVGAVIGSALGFFTCEPQRVLDGLRYAKTVYREQKRILLPRQTNFNWRRLAGKVIHLVGTIIATGIAFCLLMAIIFSWAGLLSYAMWWIGVDDGISFLVGLVLSMAIFMALNSKADLDFSPSQAVVFFRWAFIASPITVTLYWLPHYIIPKLLPIWLRALWNAAKFFVGYLATHRAVLVAFSIFTGVVVGRFLGHVFSCGVISGALCLMGILIREHIRRSQGTISMT